ncbi:MAG: glycosyltransferase family 39 protein [Pseudomonadota bacterium]
MTVAVPRGYFPALLAASILGIWVNSASLPLFDRDEGAFAQATLEMLDSGNYLTTTLNGEPRYEKPMLIYWLQATAVSTLGPTEFAFRLPTLIGATLWMWVMWNFTLGVAGPRAALVAACCVPLTLMASIVAHAATASVLLNLFLALALFDIYRYSQQPDKRFLLKVYLWMGLGFHAQGPIALAIPLLASALFYLSQQRLRDWLRAVFYFPGWALIVAVIAPWIVALALQGGTDFFLKFISLHYASRYTETMQGHGGSLYYYLLALPLIVLPFTGVLPAVFARARHWRADPLDAFLLIAFGGVFVMFSFSATQLPHYLLYGCSPLFVLLGRHLDRVKRRATLLWPVTLVVALLATLPWWLPLIPVPDARIHERALIALALQSFDTTYWLMTTLSLIALIALWLLRRRLDAALVLFGAGLIQTTLVVLGFAPVLAAVQQTPVREAALRARELALPCVSATVDWPSFSVYRGGVTPVRDPQPGELIFLLVKQEQELRQRISDGWVEEYRKGGVLLLRRLPAHAAPA